MGLTDVTAPLALLWSISVEKQFYVVWPFLLRILLRRRERTGWILGGLLALTVGDAPDRHRVVLRLRALLPAAEEALHHHRLPRRVIDVLMRLLSEI